MIHSISGEGFHGKYSFRLRGPEGGFVLSLEQQRKVWEEMCGVRDCHCVGGRYGSGPDEESARVEVDEEGYWALVPAGAE